MCYCRNHNRSNGADTSIDNDKLNSNSDSNESALSDEFDTTTATPTTATTTTSTTSATAALPQESASAIGKTADSKTHKTTKKNIWGSIAGGAEKAANGIKNKVCTDSL
jgi:hypothetical protein